MRLSIVSGLIAVLAFAFVGCGDDEPDLTPCEAACEHGRSCGLSVEGSCQEECKGLHAPDAFFRCYSSLSCEELEDDEAPVELCGDKLIGPRCTQACENLEACSPSPWEPGEARECAMGCGMVYPQETQRCMAEAEGCMELLACVQAE
jgi:hypothetical protein